MRTFKRTPNNVDTRVGAYNDSVKYFNQLQWNGLVENKNIFDVDQNSQADAKNVYVDGHGTLRSRPALLREPLDKTILLDNSRLIDMIVYGQFNFYITTFNDTLKITIDGSPKTTFSGFTKYHISTIENYVILFNDIGAKVFDINNANEGWQDFDNFVEAPVIKRVIGSEITNFNKNSFTDRYKEEYIWSNKSHPTLPSGDTTASIITNGLKKKWELKDADILTNERIMRQLSYTTELDLESGESYLSQAEIFSVAKGIICIATPNFVSISYDNGVSFTREWYPAHGKYQYIASISDDGSSFFFVASDAVYRLSLDTKTWTVIHPHNKAHKLIGESVTSLETNTSKFRRLWHFLTKDVFAFILWMPVSSTNYEGVNAFPILWFQGPWAAGYDSIPYVEDTITNTSTFKTHVQISEEYRGTLGCSAAFCREGKGGFMRITNMSGNEFYQECIPTYLKIFIDNGPVSNCTFTSTPSSSTNPNSIVTQTNRSYATIVVGTHSYSRAGSFGGECNAIYVLPGSNCPQYTHNNTTFTEALDLRPFWIPGGNDNISSSVNIGKQLSAFVGKYNWQSNEAGAEGYIATQYAPNYTSLYGESDLVTGISNNTLQVTGIRNEEVYNSESWLIGSDTEIGGERQTINAYASNGIYTLRGKIKLLQNQRTLWCPYLWQIGYKVNAGGTKVEIVSRIRIEKQHRLYYSDSAPISLNGSTTIQKNMLMYYPTSDSSSEEEYIKIANNFPAEELGFYPIYAVYVDEGYYYIRLRTGEIYTNKLLDTDIATLTYEYNTDSTYKYNIVPNVSYSSTELYLGIDNKLSITSNTRNENGILFNLPTINDQKFIDNITNIINISTTDVAIFFKNNVTICSKVEDENLGYRYDYYPTKLSTGTRLGDSIINTIEGTYTIFPTKRGLAFMNYQAFMATTDQVLTYMTDNIGDRYDAFYAASDTIKLVQIRDRLFVTNGTGDILIYDFTRGQWWFWQLPNLQFNTTFPIRKILTDQVDTYIVGYRLFKFGDPERLYLDFENVENDIDEDTYLTPKPTKIDWFIVSQPLHMKAPNYYKNLKQLVFHLLGDESDNIQRSILVQIRCYRKKLNTKEPELISFKIEELRTFVKRFNYWKINEIQYGLASDNEAVAPTQLKLNGVSIKYEIGEEVR